MYKHHSHSVGNNMKKIQITTKYRYKMMRKEELRIKCKVAIEEALKVLPEHAHMIVDCPRTMSDSKLMNLIKGFSSYLIFRLYPAIRKRYPRGIFGMEDIFVMELEIENQEAHHCIA